jgi:hypothetical protein
MYSQTGRRNFATSRTLSKLIFWIWLEVYILTLFLLLTATSGDFCDLIDSENDEKYTTPVVNCPGVDYEELVNLGWNDAVGSCFCLPKME